MGLIRSSGSSSSGEDSGDGSVRAVEQRERELDPRFVAFILPRQAGSGSQPLPNPHLAAASTAGKSLHTAAAQDGRHCKFSSD